MSDRHPNDTHTSVRDEARAPSEATREGHRDGPKMAPFDPFFGALFVDGDRVRGAVREDEKLWSGY